MASAGDGAGGEPVMMFAKFMEAQGVSALALLSEVAPPTHLVDQAQKLKAVMDDAMAAAKAGKPDQKDCAEKMVRVAYAIADMACKVYPVAGMPPLPAEDTFIAMCFGGEVDDGEKRASSLLLGQAMMVVDFGPGVGETDGFLIMLSIDSSSLNLGAPSEISTETIHMTLHVYVNIFVRAAEDSYNRRVQNKIVISFLGALKGVASVSHILLESALESLSHINPRESLSEHALNTDVKILYYEFNRKIRDLEDAFRKGSTITACELLMPTISQGVRALESFVKVMVARRQRAFKKARACTN